MTKLPDNLAKIRDERKLRYLSDEAENSFTEGFDAGAEAMRTYMQAQGNIDKLVDRFLAWSLPKSVCSDFCVTEPNYPHDRVGTNLLTAHETKQMFEYLFEQSLIDNGMQAEMDRLVDVLEEVAKMRYTIFSPEPENEMHTEIRETEESIKARKALSYYRAWRDKQR